MGHVRSRVEETSSRFALAARDITKELSHDGTIPAFFGVCAILCILKHGQPPPVERSSRSAEKDLRRFIETHNASGAARTGAVCPPEFWMLAAASNSAAILYKSQ